MRRFRFLMRKLGDRNGNTLTLYAIMLTGLLGCMALAVDVGMGFDRRSEAQRIADLSALAGASAFKDFTGLAGEAEANVRAMNFATRNYVNDALVVPSEVQITPNWIDRTVEVIVTRQSIPVWFARLLGVFEIDVQARAVAKLDIGGTANQCILPLSPPDIWHDVDDDTNGNRLPDVDEEWEFDEGDLYQEWNGEQGAQDTNGTGYGSNWRDGQHGYSGDVGSIMYLKAGPPGQSSGGGELDSSEAETSSPGGCPIRNKGAKARVRVLRGSSGTSTTATRARSGSVKTTPSKPSPETW